MALKKITLKNFKSIGEQAQTIELAPYTLLFGPNSAGKSTLMQALVYLHELLRNGTRDLSKTELGGDAVDLGGFLNVVHNRDPHRDIVFTLEFDIDESRLEFYPEPNLEWRTQVPWPYFLNGVNGHDLRAQIELAVGLDSDGDVIVKRVRTSINDSLLASISASSSGQQITLSSPALGGLLYNIEYYSAEGPLEVEWGHYERSEGPAEPSGNMAQQFAEALDDGADPIDLEELFPGLRGKLTQTWTLDQADALPERLGICYWHMEWPVDDQELYALKSDKFLGRDLNEYRLLDALICVPLGVLDWAMLELLHVGPLRVIPTAQDLSQPNISGGWASGAAAWEAGYLASESRIWDAPHLINRWLGKDYLAAGYKIRTSNTRALPEDHPILSLKSEDLDDDLLESVVAEIKSLPTTTKVFLEDETSGIELTAKDVGAGISQIFPVVVASSIGRGLVSIEQPELHVHPRLQTNLADVFIDSYTLLGTRFLLETHSEHLILRFLRRVREGHEDPESKVWSGEAELSAEDISWAGPNSERESKLPGISSDQLAIYYVLPGENGVTFQKIEVFEDGETDNWPHGFFREREAEYGLI